MKYGIFNEVIVIILFLSIGFLLGYLFNDYQYNFFNYSENNISNNTLIYFSNDIMEMLNKRFINEKMEFLYCLNGDYNQNESIIYLNKIDPTFVYSRNETNIKHSTCKTIVNIHSHPKGNCELSELDLESFNLKDIDFKCVICDINQISCFDKSNKQMKVIL